MIKIFLFKIFSIILHTAAVSLIVYILFPIMKWYVESRPLWGIDFYLTVNLASVLRDNFTTPWAFWNYGWFGGWPQFTYPFLAVYIVSFLAKFWDIVASVAYMAMGFTILFTAGSYFLYFKISKNYVLALILAVFTGLSGGVYQTLTWAGSVPSYSAQAALPWALGFLIWHKESGKIRYLLASALISGISIMVHPLVFMTYIFPAFTILIFTRFDQGFAILAKLKHFIIFLAIALIIGLPQFSTSVNFAIKNIIKPNSTQTALSTTRFPVQQDINVASFNRAQVKRIYTDNHDGIFRIAAVCAVLFLATLILSRRFFSILEIMSYALLLVYFYFYIWIFGQGISIFHGGWYRVFWSVPIWIGAFAAACWFYSEKSVYKITANISLRLVYLMVSTLLISVLGYIYFTKFSQDSTISNIIYRGEMSSAHPDILSIWPDDDQKEKYKNALLASWLDANQTNYRMYAPDQTVNLWWNSMYKMPLARGYLDPPIADEKRGFLFLLDTSLSTSEGEPQLVSVFKYPFDTAVSTALFLIDWGAVKYYEGAHTGGTSSPNVPAHLKDLIVKNEEEVNLLSLKYHPKKRTMHYFEFKDDVTSPILSATNTSTIGVFASEVGFETIVRSIAERDNINSQRLIPINLGRFIDDYNIEKLNKFDALYLYDYDYDNYERSFKLLNNYVRSGRKLFIETGVETKQSQGDLDELFPVKFVERKGLGKEWLLENPNGIFSKQVDFDSFAPPVFDGTEWKMSFAEESDLRPGAQIILKNHGKIVAASHKIGSGEIIWSGLNLAYHLNRDHNEEEAKFFVNILSSIVDISKKNSPNYSINFINSNNRQITFEKTKGILFKEMAYRGWRAKTIEGNLGKLEIYKAGPAYPGYMYIPLQNDSSGQVRLTFGGALSHKVQTLISLALVVLLFEEIALGGFIFGRIRRTLWNLSRKRVSVWWEREDEG